MANWYIDSSVLIKRYAPETGAAWVRRITDLAAGHSFTTAQLARLEVVSGLNRRVREGSLDQADYRLAVRDFIALCQQNVTLLILDDPLIQLAHNLLERHSLRTYDAIHLATALLANQAVIASGQSPLTFLAADDRLLAAAQAEGLAIDNPNHHP